MDRQALQNLERAAHERACRRAPGPPFTSLARLFPEAVSAVGGRRADGAFVARVDMPEGQAPVLLPMDPDAMFGTRYRIRMAKGG